MSVHTLRILINKQDKLKSLNDSSFTGCIIHETDIINVSPSGIIDFPSPYTNRNENKYRKIGGNEKTKIDMKIKIVVQNFNNMKKAYDKRIEIYILEVSTQLFISSLQKFSESERKKRFG